MILGCMFPPFLDELDGLNCERNRSGAHDHPEYWGISYGECDKYREHD